MWPTGSPSRQSSPPQRGGPRHARLIAGACAAIGSVGVLVWNVVAFVALGLATGSSVSVRRPARPLGTAIGALQAQLLLRVALPDVPYATAAPAAVASSVVVVSGVRHARRRERRAPQLVLGGPLLGGFATVVLLGIGLVGIQSDLRAGARAADLGLVAVRAGQTSAAVTQLERAEEHLAATLEGLARPWMRPARLLPVVGRYLDIGTQLSSAAQAVVAPRWRALGWPTAMPCRSGTDGSTWLRSPSCTRRWSARSLRCPNRGPQCTDWRLRSFPGRSPAACASSISPLPTPSGTATWSWPARADPAAARGRRSPHLVHPRADAVRAARQRRDRRRLRRAGGGRRPDAARSGR